jgi:adenine-specific DNA-methyltransferase
MTDNNLQKKVAELEAQIRKLKKNNLGLVFEDKEENVVEQSKVKVPVLKEATKNRIASNNQTPNNLMIEGDNYLALSVLNYTHKKNIDLIYIDPPFNTGARDWKYNNDYVDSEDTYRHSKWLSFMNHRLKLAKDLLKDTGFIACAIDHYELFTLGVLMDKIFGEQNRIGVVTVVHKPEGRQFANFLSPSNEFMLIYAKNRQVASFRDVVLDKEKEKEFNLSDEKGDYKLKNFIRLTDGKYSLRENKPEGFYPIYVSKDLKQFSLEEKTGFEKSLPITDKGVERVWKTFGDTFMEKVKDDAIVAKRENGKIVLYEKLRPSQVFVTHWIKKDYHGYHFGTKVLEDILGSAKQFDFPKSLNLIIDIVKLMAKKDAVVLDFFAGSGTTGHAVLEMNKIDGGNRKFILCTNNENNNGGNGGIAESVCYPRVKAVINGYKNKKGEKVAGIPSNLFYYKTDLVDIEQIHKVSDDAKICITYEAGEMIAVREDTLNEIEKNDWWQIFEGNGKLTAIYFKEDKAKLNELIAKLEKKNLPVSLYIFSWGKNEYKGEYSSANIRVEDIPEPIIEVYKELNRL